MTSQLTIPEAEKFEKPKSLAAKLAEACDEVGGVEKKGKNEAQRYSYVKAADVAKAIRHELFERGIVIIPDEVECVTQQIEFTNAKGEKRNANEVQIKTAYHITDGNETLTMHGYGIAWDSGDKAIYKAKTGSLKYFLRGLGLIPDEKDDPEADESIDRAVKAESDDEYDQRTDDQRRIGSFQVNALHEAMKRTGKTEPQVAEYLKTKGLKQFEEVMKGDFQEVLKWMNKPIAIKGDLLPDLEKSVAQVTMKRIFAAAGKKHVPEGDVKQYAYEQFDVQSMTALTPEQLTAVLKWIENLQV